MHRLDRYLPYADEMRQWDRIIAALGLVLIGFGLGVALCS